MWYYDWHCSHTASFNYTFHKCVVTLNLAVQLDRWDFNAKISYIRHAKLLLKLFTVMVIY